MADAPTDADAAFANAVERERAGDLDGAAEAWAYADEVGSRRGAFHHAALLDWLDRRPAARAAYERAAARGVEEARAALARIAPAGAAQRTLAPTRPILLEGADVRHAQAALGAAGHRVAVDGFYGPETQAAVSRFQEKSRLAPDGIVGAATWELLGLSPSVRAALSRLTADVTASAVVIEILALHPEYGAQGAGRVPLDRTAGPTLSPARWVERVRARASRRRAPQLHGRLFVAALAAIDETVGAAVADGGFHDALVAELREPLEELLVDDGAASAETFDFLATATADLPASEDLLGFRPLVSALHTLLDDERTVLPLAIAVTAPWGAGKSSIMVQLRRALEEPPPDGASHRRWATVQFDAWKYERSERLWAALAKAIYEQPQARMGLRERLGFRLAIERRRLGGWKLLTMTVWPFLAAVAAVTASLAANLTPGGTFAALATSAAAISAGASRWSSLAVDPFKRAIDRHARRPDYESQLGFTAEADRDIQVLTRVLAPDDRHGLAIFVDDLDRCSSAHVVEVVEAMNQIFNAAQDSRCAFVLGLDRDVVASNIEVAYAPTVARLREARSALADRFGLEFLAKLVQLSVAIPEPHPDALRALLSQVTGSPAPTDDAPPPEAAVAAAAAAIEQAAPDTLAAIEDVAADVAPAVATEAVRRVRAQRLRDSDEVIRAEFAALRHLDANPRQVKRFHNAFRLQLYVANEDPRVDFGFTADQLVALGRWVALRLRWPGVGDAIARSPALLEVLEGDANGGPASAPKVSEAEAERLRRDHPGTFGNAALLDLLHDAEPARRVSALPLRTFLRVA